MFRFLRRDARSSAGPRRKKPGLSIVVVVRNMPREARRTLLSLSAGYQRRIGAAEYEVIVVDNGSDAPGTLLDDCSLEFRQHFANADLIIAKGQGNFESLNQQPNNIFFLFKVKCPMVARHAMQPVGTQVLVRSSLGALAMAHWLYRQSDSCLPE